MIARHNATCVYTANEPEDTGGTWTIVDASGTSVHTHTASETKREAHLRVLRKLTVQMWSDKQYLDGLWQQAESSTEGTEKSGPEPEITMSRPTIVDFDGFLEVMGITRQILFDTIMYLFIDMEWDSDHTAGGQPRLWGALVCVQLAWEWMCRSYVVVLRPVDAYRLIKEWLQHNPRVILGA